MHANNAAFMHRKDSSIPITPLLALGPQGLSSQLPYSLGEDLKDATLIPSQGKCLHWCLYSIALPITLIS